MNEREVLKLTLAALKQIDEAMPFPVAKLAIMEAEKALAQPEQKPVACVQDLDEVKRKHLVYEKGMDWKDPLYTTPPHRTWVGLTDEERGQAINANFGTGLWAMAKDIEAKLKEKNT